MTERYLRKPSHLIRQLTLGLAVGAIGFYLLSNSIPSSKRNIPSQSAAVPLSSAASEQPSRHQASVWVRADALALPLPGLVSDAEYAARQQEILAAKVAPWLGRPASTAPQQGAKETTTPEHSTSPDPVQQAKPPVAASKDATAPSAAPAPTPKSKPQGDKPGSVTLTPTHILNQKESSHLSVQLMGASRLDAIERFVVAHQLSGKVWVYRTQLHGNPWYVVLKGDHANMTLATAAIRNLPPALLKAKPWPKSFAQVKEELKR